MRKRIAHHIQNSDRYYRTATNALRQHIQKHLPNTNINAACRELRLVHLIDRSDAFCSAFRFTGSLQRDVIAHDLPPAGRPTLILSAHRGNGWWTLPVLNAQGQAAHFVSGPQQKPGSLMDWIYEPYRRLRWRELNRLGGVPIIPMRGASHRMREVLRQSGRVIALIDIPSRLAKRCSPVQFLDQTAYMPRQAIDNALACGADIYFCASDIHLQTLQQHIRFTPIESTADAQTAFQQYANLLEKHIRERPGSWHAWGHVDLFFEEPSKPAM